ncbi:MAG: ABC transporter ATP-binding protein [Eubacteriales bacterium]
MASTKNYGTLYKFMKGSRLSYALGLLFMALNVVIGYIAPLVTAWTIDGIIRKQTLDAPSFVLDLIARLGGEGYLASNLWICGLAIVVLTALRGLFGFLQGWLITVASEDTVKRVKDSLYSHLQNLPYNYHVKAETGDLIQRCTSDVDTVRRFISGQLVELCRGVCLLTAAVVILSRINWLLTVFSLILMPFAMFFSYRYSSRIEKQFKEVDEADGAMSTALQENLTGVRVVRAFGRQAYEREKFGGAVGTLFAKVDKLNNMFAFFWSFSDFTAVAQMALTMFGSMYFVISGDMSYGMFLVFNTYVGMLVWPLRQLGRVLADAAKMSIAMGRISEILDVKDEYADERDTLTPPLDGDIVFDGVSFGYDGKDVLKDVSFTARRGQTVAILGPTGSGKSSMMHLLQRLFDYGSGSITIGGTELRKIDKKYLRSKVGIVLQEPFLYSKTLLENIGIADECPDADRVYDMASVASVHEVIQSFEDKYDTVVGERGVTLSGGQKQRVAIARTLMKDNSILIFDDSLSAVDTETDAAIRKALSDRFEGITTFIISHRVATLSQADKILVLEDGRITQSGTHEELITREGMYKRIYEIQSLSGEEEAS